MSWLLDTNMLLRWVQSQHPLHALCGDAIREIRRRHEELLVTPQNLIEFWNVATRPLDKNGFGYTAAWADAEVSRIERVFDLAPDTGAVYPQWRRLVSAHAVSGVKAHDARLAAVMLAHGITHLLTLNPSDFARYDEITAVHPREVGTQP
ncbi:MAG: type II toxin-antitoxin system VapC family toxin [Armatimonadetes bacterium]|nr:type II toxin-antitoxin system VapC family toxin [Armatimonadota bacterium]